MLHTSMHNGYTEGNVHYINIYHYVEKLFCRTFVVFDVFLCYHDISARIISDLYILFCEVGSLVLLFFVGADFCPDMCVVHLFMKLGS